MVDTDSEEDRQTALNEITARLSIAGKYGARLLMYTAALAAVAAIAGVTPPTALDLFVTGTGINLLSSIVERVARGEQISDSELQREVERAIDVSGIVLALEKLLTTNEFYRAVAKMRRSQDMIRQDVWTVEHNLTVKLDELLSRMNLLNIVASVTATPPAPPPYFVGRRRLVDAVKVVLIEEKAGTTIALQGMGGIGKTATASKIAHEASESFPGGVFWGSLVQAGGEPQSILDSWESICGYAAFVEEEPEEELFELEKQIVRVRGLLTDRKKSLGKILAVIDDVRLEWLKSLLFLKQSLPRFIPLIITTRDESVAVALEAIVYNLSLYPLFRDESIALLTHYAPLAVEDRETDIGTLVELVGYLPLAIKLAGMILAIKTRKPGDHLSPLIEAIKNQAVEVLRFPGHPGLAATFSISFASLPSDIQHLFRWLGVFTSSNLFLEHLAGIMELTPQDVEVQLDLLVSAALLDWGEMEGIYTIHPLLQQYAQSLLTESNLNTEARRQHLKYYYLYARETEQENIADMANVKAAEGYAVEIAREQGTLALPYPLPETEIHYCVRCRERRTGLFSYFVRMKNGQLATRSICEVCTRTMFRIGRRLPPSPSRK